MGTRLRACMALVGICLLVFSATALAQKQEGSATKAIREQSAKSAADFNAGKVEEFAASFLPNGELIDEDGNVYEGQREIRELAGAFFKKFPGAKLALQIESVRVLGGVAIEEGTRTISTQDGSTKSQFRYIAVRAKNGDTWPIASFRDFLDDAPPTPREMLQPLAWLVGEWVNEGSDGKVAITYRWSEDQNYLLAEFQIDRPEKRASKSSQRIGWDPLTRKIRSWLFDADGGYADGFWTALDGEIVIKSSSVNPDGSTASATMTITPKDKDHFTITGTDRIVGDDREGDFEINVARRPPVPMK